MSNVHDVLKSQVIVAKLKTLIQQKLGKKKSESPTPQRNESIIVESIFGIDVTITEITPRQEFSTSYNRLMGVSQEDNSIPAAGRETIKPNHSKRRWRITQLL